MDPLQLTDNQQKLIAKTDKAGNLPAVAFVNNIPKQTKIRFIIKEDLGPALGLIFQNLSLLLGIKDPISQINKNDIKKLILSHYSNLSLEQIVYAFELERYGQLQPKTKHFQFINAEYVASVLSKYKNWVAKIRFDNNIPLPTNQPKYQNPTLSEKEKIDIMISGALRVFNEFLETDVIKPGNTHIYDFLIEDLKVHQFTDKEIKGAESLSVRKLKEESKTLDRYKASKILNEIKNPKSKKLENLTKKLLLTSYFNTIKNKDLTSIIKQNLKI